MTTSSHRLEMVDLTSPGARALMWLFFLTQVALALWTLNGVYSPFPTILAILAFTAVCIIFTVDRAMPLSLRSTWAVIVLSVAGTALVIWQLKSDVGYATWNFGASGASLFFVALRGRMKLAWIGFAAFAALILLWGATTDHGVYFAALHVARQLAVLVIGSLFARGLRRTGDQVERLSREATALALNESQQLAVDAERSQRLLALGEFVTPLLNRLASGQPSGASERLDFALAEAELRDGLRARGLHNPVLAQAARAARRRGVSVVLLDDSDAAELEADTMKRIVARIVEVLDDAESGRVTARLLPPKREAAATIVVDGAEHRSETISAGD